VSTPISIVLTPMSLSLRLITSEVVSTTVRHNCRDALFLQSELLSEITIVQKTKFVRSHLLFPILSKGDGPTFQLSRQIVGFNIVFMSEMFSPLRLQLDERWQAILVVWLQNPLVALTESQITAHWCLHITELSLRAVQLHYPSQKGRHHIRV